LNQGQPSFQQPAPKSRSPFVATLQVLAALAVFGMGSCFVCAGALSHGAKVAPDTAASASSAPAAAPLMTAAGGAPNAPYVISGLTAEPFKLRDVRWLSTHFRVTSKAEPSATKNENLVVKFDCVMGVNENATFDVEALMPEGFGAVGQTVNGAASTQTAHPFAADPLDCTLTFLAGPLLEVPHVNLGEFCIAASGKIAPGPCAITALRRK